ncbi:unnamed protein product [Dibothriocephalus latus]|uniref:Uncharacterized protein n=1 Tax=Dibothriocephalus latus TaxID=60516 RepID=A0A3P7NPS0_DIBLA|nr:unnamed protein product [Dibothriocephalus latus]
MVSQCLQFAERLRYHPGIDSFESAMDGGRCGLGTAAADLRTTRQFAWVDRLREVYDRLCGQVSYLLRGVVSQQDSVCLKSCARYLLFICSHFSRKFLLFAICCY